MRLWILLILFFGLFSAGCSILAQKVSQEQDATMAYKLSAPQLHSFRFSEVKTLKKILGDHNDKYRVGLAYLRKVADLYQNKEGIDYDKRITLVEMDLNLLEARIKNLSILYPEYWDNEKEELHQALEKVRTGYKTIYETLI